MTQLATQPPATGNGNTASTTAIKPPSSRSHDTTPGVSNLMDTDRFEQMVRVSVKMAYIAPKHLKGEDRDPQTSWNVTCANCFKIANLAFRMGVDPFALMDESYVVHGKLGFQGKLVAGVVNSRAELVNVDGSKGRLAYDYEKETGKPDELTIVVSGQFKGEAKARVVKLSVGQAKTDNDMWREDPYQKLIYSGAVRWARAYCPEIMLGIVTDDDLDRMREAGRLSGDGTSLAHRSELTDTLSPEGDLPTGNADAGQTDPTGNAAGLEHSGEGSQGAAPETGNEGSGPEDVQITPKGMELIRKIDAAAGDKNKLIMLSGDAVALYGKKEGNQDPEGQFVFGKIDELLAQAKPKK